MPGRHGLTAAAAGLALVAVALLVYFDLQTVLPLGDEWVYAWEARHLAGGLGLQLFPEVAATALVQLAWSLPAAFAGADLRLLRLSLLPFALLLGWCLFGLARGLGASREWAVVAAVVPAGVPVFMAVAGAYMTDLVYCALLLLAALLAARWLRDGRGRVLLVVVVALTVLQRQVGIAIPVALSVALLMRPRGERRARADWGWLAALWLVALAALALPGVTGLASEQMRSGMAAVHGVDPLRAAAGVLYLPPMLGLFLLPFAPALFMARRGRPGAAASRRWATLAVGLATALGATSLLATRIFPGDYLTAAGLGPLTMAGAKPALFGPLLLVLGAAAVLAFVVAAGAMPGPRALAQGRPEVVLLLGLAVIQLVPLVQLSAFDRYYLAVALPLLPLAAAVATRAGAGRRAMAWALVVVAAGLAFYAVGEQDYRAWQEARAATVEDVFSRTPAAQVAAGYEPYAVYVVLPMFEATGRLPGPISNGPPPSYLGPASPTLVVLFAAADDPRPGRAYTSLAPGKVVVVGVDASK